MDIIESIQNMTVIKEPQPTYIKISLSQAISLFEEKKEISCDEYNDFYEHSKKIMKKADREELLKHFKLKPDSSGYEFIKDL